MRIIQATLKGYKWMIRAFTLALLTSLVLFPFLSKTGQAQSITLKHDSVVTDSVIKLGDIFSGLSVNEDKVLGAAPRPGTEMVLNARTLMRVAMAMDLPWRPGTSTDRVVLKRAATLIDRNMIEDKLKEAIAEDGYTGKFGLVIPNANTEIILPLDETASVEVERLRVQKDRNVFEAILVAPSKARPLQKLTVHGNIERLVDVPVLRETLQKGTIIGARDIEILEINERSLQHDTIVNPESLLGKTPRRLLAAGDVITANDVEEPRIIERGDMITMVFKQGPLQLTAQGKALEHGAKGDTIRVVNTTSSQTVEGVVSAVKEVTVRTF